MAGFSRSPSPRTAGPSVSLWTLILLYCIGLAAAQDTLRSTTSTSCQNNSSITDSHLNASVNRDNNTISYTLVGDNTFSGNATIIITLGSPGQSYYTSTLDPCGSLDLRAFCPSSGGYVRLSTSQEVPRDAVEGWPDSLFTEPDQNARLRFQLKDTATGNPVACVEAELENGSSQAPDLTTASSAPEQTTMSSGSAESTASSSVGSSSSSTTSDSPSSTGAAENSSIGVTSLSWTLILCALIFWTCQLSRDVQ